jgi:hypothetical protein
MATFSVTEAVSSGFGVIGRRPLAVIAWGLVMTVLLALPILAMFGLMGGQFLAVFEAARHGGGGESNSAQFERLMALQSGMMGFNLLNWVWGTFVRAIICAAIFRAVLAPGDSRWAYLRVGAQELWLALLFLVETVLAVIVTVVAVLGLGILITVGIVATGGVGNGPNGSHAAVMICAVLVLALVLGWVCLRLSMAGPMTFADREFRLFESWTMTRMQDGRLVGVGLLLLLILIGMQILVGITVLILIGGAAGASGMLADVQRLEAFFEQPLEELLARFWPWLLVGGAVSAVVSSVMMTILCAPWVAIYRSLAAPVARPQDVSPSAVAPS